MFYKMIPKHKSDKFLGANISQNLRGQLRRSSMRVIKGDTVKILRGEYVGIEGKVEKVNTKRSTLSIEGVQREKIRGGNVKVQIHASNVQIIGLNTDDKRRIKVIDKGNKTQKLTQKEEKKKREVRKKK